MERSALSFTRARSWRLPGAQPASAPAPDTLTDAQIKAYAASPFDKAKWALKRKVLGIHHGTRVVADFPCSDICPDYTVRIIHYAVEPGPACDAIGGVEIGHRLPLSVGADRYCVPAAAVGVEAPRPWGGFPPKRLDPAPLAFPDLSAYLPPLARKAVLVRFPLSKRAFSPFAAPKDLHIVPARSFRRGPDAAFLTEEG